MLFLELKRDSLCRSNICFYVTIFELCFWVLSFVVLKEIFFRNIRATVWRQNLVTQTASVSTVLLKWGFVSLYVVCHFLRHELVLLIDFYTTLIKKNISLSSKCFLLSSSGIYPGITFYLDRLDLLSEIFSRIRPSFSSMFPNFFPFQNISFSFLCLIIQFPSVTKKMGSPFSRRQKPCQEKYVSAEYIWSILN